MWRTPSTGLREPFGLPQQTRTFLYRRLRWFDSATSLSWNVRFLIDQGTPRDCADLIDSEAATAWAVAARAEEWRFGQQPWQMVFSFASNFEFSAASMSTTCPCSGGVSDAAGLASPGRILDVAGLAAAIGWRGPKAPQAKQ